MSPAKKVTTPTAAPVILTNSSKMMFLSCRQKFQFAYEEKLEVNKPKAYLTIGDIMGEAIQSMMLHHDLKDVLDRAREQVKQARKLFIGDPAVLQKFEKDVSIIDGMILGWNENRGMLSDLEVLHIDKKPCVELPFDIDMGRGLHLKGALDVLCYEKKNKDKLWIVENKNVGRLDKNYVARLPIDSQVTTYFFAMKYALPADLVPKVQGILYNVLGKTQIRPKKEESQEAFQTRVVDMYADTDPEVRSKLFYQEKLYRSQSDLDRFETEIHDTADAIRKARHNGIWQRNDKFCTYMGLCEFLPICTRGKRADVMRHYKVREFLHQEVDEEE